jgi:hypothetical protein
MKDTRMSRLITVALALALTASVPVVALARPPAVPRSANAQDSAKKETERERIERKARKILELNGTKEVQTRSLGKMMDAFKNMSLPDGFVDKFKSSFDFDRVFDMAVKVYADNLDEATLDALLAFYETPGGKSFAAAMPEIQDELIAGGMKYGQELAKDVMQQIGK